LAELRAMANPRFCSKITRLAFKSPGFATETRLTGEGRVEGPALSTPRHGWGGKYAAMAVAPRIVLEDDIRLDRWVRRHRECVRCTL
jgi:hypothetical protein